jgi:hypothetical protein
MTAAPLTMYRNAIRGQLKGGLLVVVILVLGIGGWAFTTEISGAIQAPGAIVVDSNVKKVQHPTGGIIGEIRARDGDVVKAGDIWSGSRPSPAPTSPSSPAPVRADGAQGQTRGRAGFRRYGFAGDRASRENDPRSRTIESESNLQTVGRRQIGAQASPDHARRNCRKKFVTPPRPPARRRRSR